MPTAANSAPVPPAESAPASANAPVSADELAEILRMLAELDNQLASERARQCELVRQLANTRERLMQAEQRDTLEQLAIGVVLEIDDPVATLVADLGALSGYASDLLKLADATPAEIPAVRSEIAVDWVREDIPKVIAEMNTALSRVRRTIDALRDMCRPHSLPERK